MVFNLYKNYDMFLRNKNIEIIPSLYTAFLLNKSSIKREVVRKLTEYSKDFSSKDYINLSKEFRKRTLFNLDINWQEVEVKSLLEDCMTEDEKIMILGLSSMHPSGFIREKALRELEKYDEAKVLKFVAIRACDWISEIRLQAQQYLIKVLHVRNLESIVQNIMLIHRIEENIKGLKIYYRYSYEEYDIEGEELFYKEVISRIGNILSSSENKDDVTKILVEKSIYKDDYIKEYALKELIKNSLLSYREVLKMLKKVKNPIICTRCIRLILERLSDEEVIELKNDLYEVKGAKAKDIFLTRLCTIGYFKDAKELGIYALSKYSIVRDTARFYMKKLGFKDINKFYIEKLNDKLYEKNALLGLCEVCGEDEVEILLNNIHNNNNRTKLQRKILNKLIELEEDSALLDKETLFELYKTQKNETTKGILVKAIFSGNGWNELFYSLMFLDDENELSRASAKLSIENWINEKNSYFVNDNETGKIKHYSLSRMSETMAVKIKDVMNKNEHLLEGYYRSIIKGLILNYS